MTEHTKACVRWTAKAKMAIYAYVAKWPNYCRKCNGAGAHEYRDCVTVDPYPMYMDCREPCTCVEDGVCPQCGKQSIVWLVGHEQYEDYERYANWDYPDGHTPFCVSCGWMDGYDYQTAGCPEMPECDCWDSWSPRSW